MSAYFRVLRIGLVGLAMLGMISSATSGGTQGVSVEETVRMAYSTTSCSESIVAPSTSPATASKGG
jgi:hypothetical protein